MKTEVTGRPKHYYSIYQKMIVRGREFRRHLRPRRHPRAGRPGTGLLRGARRGPRELAAGARPVQGLHRERRSSTCTSRCTRRSSARAASHVELQIRTHDMHRTAEYGIAAHWKYKQRKGVEVSDPRGISPTRWAGCGSCWTGSARRRSPEEFLDELRYDLGSNRGLRLHAASGDAVPAARRARHPSTSPTPCTPRSGTAASAPASTASSSRWRARLDHGDIVEIFSSKSENSGPSRDWLEFVKSRAGHGRRSGSGSRKRTPRGRDRRRQDSAVQGDAQGRAADPAAARRRSRCSPSPRTCTTPTSPRSTPPSARVTCRRSRSCTRSSRSSAGPRAPMEDIAEAIVPAEPTPSLRERTRQR